MELIFAIGIGVTKAVDAVRNALDPHDVLPKVTWNLLAFGLGIGAAFLAGVEAPDVFGGFAGVGGRVVAGLLIGAAGSGWHEILDALSSYAGIRRAAPPRP